MPQEFYLPFIRYKQEAKDAYTFFFDRTASNFSFLPGQYVRIFLDIPEPDNRGNARFFSITSSPLDMQYLTVTTRIIQSAFKKTLLTLQEGTKVRFFGPNGSFVLKEEETNPKIFLAGGIGVTPIHSMLLFSAEKKLLTERTLIASFSTVEDMVFYDDLMNLSKAHPTMKIIYTVTQPEESTAPWQGEKGRITEELIKKYAPNFTNASIFISGPPTMVEGIGNVVRQMGIADQQVHKENFTGY